MGSANGKAAAIKIIDRPGHIGQGGAFVMETSCVSVLGRLAQRWQHQGRDPGRSRSGKGRPGRAGSDRAPGARPRLPSAILFGLAAE